MPGGNPDLIFRTIGGEMIAWFERGAQFFGSNETAERYPAPDGLGETHDVGLDAVILMGEVFACPAKAGEYFIMNKRDVMAPTDVLDLRPVLVGWNYDATDAEDRLSDHGRSRTRDTRMQQLLHRISASHPT